MSELTLLPGGTLVNVLDLNVSSLLMTHLQISV